MCEADIPEAPLARADHIHLTGYSFVSAAPRGAARRVIERAGATPVSVDPASAEFLREIGPANFLSWTRGAAICFPNSDEAATLAGTLDHPAQMAELVRAYRLVVVKRGAGGCEAAEGARRWRAAAPPARAIDTTGAGDAFVAGFLAERLAGGRIEQCLARAAAAGAEATEIIGGRPGAS